MYYAPHIMQKRITPEQVNDEFGRPIVSDENTDQWVDVCQCRCDHNGDKEIKLPDGTIIRPDYRVVCDGNTPELKAGDYVRCLREDGSERGAGEVIKLRTLNYLPYAEVYLQD